MSACRQPKYKQLLHAYDLGLLNSQEREELERHLMGCDECFAEAQLFVEEAHLIKGNKEIQAHIGKLALENMEPERPKPKISAIIWPVAAAAILVLLLVSPWQIDIKTTDELVAVENKLLVMNFESETDVSGKDNYGQIISHILISELSSQVGTHVVSSQRLYDINRILTEKTSTVPTAMEAAEYARAKWLIRGTYTITDSVLTINAQLIEVSDGHIIEAFVIDGIAGDKIFSQISKLSGQINRRLLPDMYIPSQNELIRTGTESEEAYAYYISGLDKFRKYFYQKATADFEKALEYDSTFAMPYYYLSRLKDRQLIYTALQYSDNISKRDSMLIANRRLIVEGKTDSSLQFLHNFVQLYPDEKEAYFQLGVNYYTKVNFDSSLANIKQVIQFDPFYKEAYNMLAYTYAMLDDYDNAISSIDRYIDLATDEPNPYDSKGALHAVFGQLDKAIGAYKEALRIKPDFLSSLSFLSYMYLFKNDYNRFDSCNTILLHTDSEVMKYSARLYEPYVYIRQGKLHKAMAVLDENIQKDLDDNVDPLHLMYKHNLKAILFEGLGYPDSALAVLEQDTLQSRLIPRLDFMHYRMYLNAQLDEREEISRLLDSLGENFEEMPYGYFTHWFGWGMYEFSCDNYKWAADYFDASVTQVLEPNAYGNYVGQYMAGLAYYYDGNYAKAAERFEHLKRTYTSRRLYWSVWDIKLLYYLGRVYEESNWYDRAITEYTEFLLYMGNADFDSELAADARERVKLLENRL